MTSRNWLHTILSAENIRTPIVCWPIKPVKNIHVVPRIVYPAGLTQIYDTTRIFQPCDTQFLLQPFVECCFNINLPLQYSKKKKNRYSTTDKHRFIIDNKLYITQTGINLSEPSLTVNSHLAHVFFFLPRRLFYIFCNPMLFPVILGHRHNL